MGEPWTSRPLQGRSRVRMGELGDVTRRQNSQEASRLEVRIGHMVKELDVNKKDLRHEQAALERCHGRTRRTSASVDETRHLLIEREQETMRSLNNRCKVFIQSSGSTEFDGRMSATTGGGGPPDEGVGVRIPTDTGGLSDQEPPNHADQSSADLSQDGRRTPRGRVNTTHPTDGRERRVSMAHPTDVHLELDPCGAEKTRSTPMRRSNVLNHRRIGTSPKWDSSNQPKLPTWSKREVDTKVNDDTQQLANEEEGNLSQESRRKSLPLVLGRRMTRHDRSSSKSREQLLLPNLGQPRAHSPAQDMRVKISYAGEDVTPIRDAPSGRSNVRKTSFSLLSPRNLASPVTSSEASSPMSSARSSRLEIDLSIPQPRSRHGTSKREKTYTV